MKLYTYTLEHSLPRLALKGLSRGFPLYGTPIPAAEMAHEDDEPKDRAVVLEVDADGLESVLVVTGERVEDVATMASEDISGDPERPDGKVTEEQAQKAYDEVYGWADELGSLGDMLEKFDVVENVDIIPASRITVLGIGNVEYSEDLDQDPTVTFKSKPKPLKAFQQPFVSRLLRSIFLPQHKLYGAGKRRSPAMGFLSRFRKHAPAAESVDPSAPDVVQGVALVWAAGKTFERGMKGAFRSDGQFVARAVTERLGRTPGKLLGSGAMGAVYSLGQNVLKVTMDANELHAAANLKGVRHPNLSEVFDVFIVDTGGRGAGFIVRSAIDTTLDRFDPKTAEALDMVMDDVLKSASDKIGFDAATLAQVDMATLSSEVGRMIELLREDGCATEEGILLDLADAFRELRYLGIVGIDFDAKNVGVIRKPKPRVVLFDYGMTKSPSIDIEVVSLESVRT